MGLRTVLPWWYFEIWMVLNHDLLLIVVVLIIGIDWVACKTWLFEDHHMCF